MSDLKAELALGEDEGRRSCHQSLAEHSQHKSDPESTRIKPASTKLRTTTFRWYRLTFTKLET